MTLDQTTQYKKTSHGPRILKLWRRSSNLHNQLDFQLRGKRKKLKCQTNLKYKIKRAKKQIQQSKSLNLKIIYKYKYPPVYILTYIIAMLIPVDFIQN